MRLEPLARLIEACDPATMREVGLLYLRLRGYQDVQLKDGWGDGGSDFAVATYGGNPNPIGVQVTVQRRGWKAKLKADAARAHEKLGVTHMLYITSRRLPQTEVIIVGEDLRGSVGVSLQPIDSQAIASFFFERDVSDQLLAILGVPLTGQRPNGLGPPTLREEAAYAFAFFGDATDQFRQGVLEQAAVSEITERSDGAMRKDVIAAVVGKLNLEEDQSRLVDGAIDRLLQAQRVEQTEGVLRPAGNVADAYKAVRATRDKQWSDLASAVEAYLAGLGLLGGALEHAREVVMESAGALLMLTAEETGKALTMADDTMPIRQQLRKRIRQVSNALDLAELSAEKTDESLKDLAELIGRSDIGEVLVAGELFVALVSLGKSRLFTALGGSDGLDVYLDTSVAMPMLTGLLYEPSRHRFSQAAMRSYRMSRARDASLKLPRVYLEEAASHLIDAFEEYRFILGEDADLQYSGNAFVGHFVALMEATSLPELTFERYVESFGYSSALRGLDPQIRRQRVMDAMSDMFAKYHIEVVDFGRTSPNTLKEVQQAVAFTARELDLKDRPRRLLDHDASVIAYLMGPHVVSDVARIFCTWDRLHLKLRTHQGKAEWQALDPAMLSDVMVLARSDDLEEGLFATTNLALELSEAEGQRGADVWDTLVHFERGKMFDAELIRHAREFKEDFMQSRRDEGGSGDIAAAWKAWKTGEGDGVSAA